MLEINESLSPAERKKRLFLNQKELLDDFLHRGAISKAQYDKSYGDLKAKMHLNDAGETEE